MKNKLGILGSLILSLVMVGSAFANAGASNVEGLITKSGSAKNYKPKHHKHHRKHHKGHQKGMKKTAETIPSTTPNQ